MYVISFSLALYVYTAIDVLTGRVLVTSRNISWATLHTNFIVVHLSVNILNTCSIHDIITKKIVLYMTYVLMWNVFTSKSYDCWNLFGRYAYITHTGKVQYYMSQYMGYSKYTHVWINLYPMGLFVCGCLKECVPVIIQKK